MTDNIFEIETIALAHVECAPRESGILLTDFAAAYPGVNHSWIFQVPGGEKARRRRGGHHTLAVRSWAGGWLERRLAAMHHQECQEHVDQE